MLIREQYDEMVKYATASSTTRWSSTPPLYISDQAWQASFTVAVGASAYATYACVDTWLTDFRGDLPKITVPTLVVHGTADRILPFSATAERLPGLIKDVRLVKVEGGPHNIAWTHPDEVNPALLSFLAE